ncbi:hypothetical protein TIFTF001_027020 [Ficus carica]|uniref:Uncharacterized protein n=1 Tax=Ficus carica TaxID=3494 RepID=A0AA88DM79_FICCA|nr:hypothetical protein TIFTF001_027020 [Ficus carica]
MIAHGGREERVQRDWVLGGQPSMGSADGVWGGSGRKRVVDGWGRRSHRIGLELKASGIINCRVKGVIVKLKVAEFKCGTEVAHFSRCRGINSQF